MATVPANTTTLESLDKEQMKTVSERKKNT